MPAYLIAEEGPQRGLVLDLTEGEDWVIGRDPDVADFVLEDSIVSRQHARITKQPQGFFLQNLSHTNPILINGEERNDSERVLLSEGDKIQIGHTIFSFSEHAPSEEEHEEHEPNDYDEIFGRIEEPPPPSREAEPDEVAPSESIRSEEEPTYDTVFEDAEEEEPPFPLLQPTALLLKVISGPNAGAEIGIEKGRTYVLGKDPKSCDIVFQDLSVSRNHARLTVSEEGTLEIEDLGSKNNTLINGQPIHEKVALTSQDLIAMGTTIFLIIDREAPQETIFSPLLPSYVKEEEEAEEAEAPVPAEVDWRAKPIPKKHLILGAAFVSIILIIALSFFSLFKSSVLPSPHKEPESHIQEALAKYPGVQYSFNPASGRLFLVGHVLTPVQYQEMLFDLGQIAMIRSLDNNVVIDELVWRSVNEMLGTFPAWRGVSIHAAQPGRFIVNGYVDTNELATSIWAYLTLNFPYLDRLQNNLVVEENLHAFVGGLLLTHDFGSVLHQISAGELTLAGSYPQAKEAEYHQLLKQFEATPGISLVRNFAIVATQNTGGINITENYQVTGSSVHEGMGFSVILNGRIFTVGDVVDGMTITNIDRTVILLEKDGLKYRIDYR